MAAVSDMVGTRTGSRIHVELDLPDAETQDLYVNADPSQFDTALVNLVVNARDAMDGEGRLRIGLRRTGRIPAVRAHPPQRGDYIVVSITDTGAGIAPENLERIFEPFFAFGTSPEARLPTNDQRSETSGKRFRCTLPLAVRGRAARKRISRGHL